MKQELFEQYVKLVTENNGAYKLAARKLVKDKLKQHLAVITSQYLQEGMPTSKAAELAKASDEYKQKLDEATKLLMDAEVILAKQKSIEMQFEYWRSTESTKRKEMDLEKSLT